MFFLPNLYTIEVMMITYFMGMVDLPNLGHMTASTVQYNSI